MCVFKYHAFIFYIRPPRWRCKTLFIFYISLNILQKCQHFGNFARKFCDKLSKIFAKFHQRKISWALYYRLQIQRKQFINYVLYVRGAKTLLSKRVSCEILFVRSTALLRPAVRLGTNLLSSVFSYSEIVCIPKSAVVRIHFASQLFYFLKHCCNYICLCCMYFHFQLFFSYSTGISLQRSKKNFVEICAFWPKLQYMAELKEL